MKIKQLLTTVKLKPWHWWLALAITLLAGFLRLYRIPDTVMFLGDQGRDALMVADMFRNLDPVFIGPVTSIGNMYLGPFYYYFMLPFLWLTYPSPLGPVYAVAIFSTITVFLMYWCGRRMFSPLVGLIASFLLAVSTAAVDISRFSWNPNLAPLVSLLMIYFSWKALKKPKNWLVVALLFSIIIQLHYLTLLSGASLFLIWLVDVIIRVRHKLKKQPALVKKYLKKTAKICAGCIAIIIVSMLPLILFDIKHNFLNARAFQDLFVKERIFTSRQNDHLWRSVRSIITTADSRTKQILVRIPWGRIEHFELSLAIILLLALLTQAWRLNHQTKLKRTAAKSDPADSSHAKLQSQLEAILIIISFIIVGIAGTAIYQESVYHHYIAYLLPVIFFIYAIVLSSLQKINKWLFLGSTLIVLAAFTINNAVRWPLKPNYLYQRTRQTSQQIYDLIKPDETYQIVLLSGTKDLYGQSYRYFLSTTDKPPVSHEQTPNAQTLVIIDEEKQVENIMQLPIYEIMLFSEHEPDQHLSQPDLPDIFIVRSNNN